MSRGQCRCIERKSSPASRFALTASQFGSFEPDGVSAVVRQEAAGAFGYLQARVVPQLTTPRPEDLSQECSGMLAALCMAQVQATPDRHLSSAAA